MDKGKRKKRLLTLGLVGCGIVALAFTLVTTAFEAILLWTFLMLTGIFIGSSSSTMIAEFSEESSRATAMSVYSLFGALYSSEDITLIFAWSFSERKIPISL